MQIFLQIKSSIYLSLLISINQSIYPCVWNITQLLRHIYRERFTCLFIYIYKHQSKSTITRWRHRILRHCSGSTTRGHAGSVPLYHLSRLRTENIDWQNQREWLWADVEKKQKVPSKNNYLRQHSDTGKYTRPNTLQA